jgi:hypothetical protein
MYPKGLIDMIFEVVAKVHEPVFWEFSYGGTIAGLNENQ